MKKVLCCFVDQLDCDVFVINLNWKTREEERFKI